MTLNKKHLKNTIKNIGYVACLFTFQDFFVGYQLFAQESYELNEMEINRTSSLDEEGNLDFPTNPFEIVDRIRRANSMNDATKPSEAIDDAIKSFDMINVEKQI